MDDFGVIQHAVDAAYPSQKAESARGAVSEEVAANYDRVVRRNERGEPLSADEARAQQHELNDAKERAKITAEPQPLPAEATQHELAPILSGDEVRKTMPGYDPNNWRTHVDKSGYVAPRMEARFRELLETRKGKGNGEVVFLAGGNGSGKSTGAAALGSTPDFIVDSTLGNLEVAKRQIDAVLANGQKPVIDFVYRDPEQALAGVRQRVENGGHAVSPLSFADSHTKGIWNLRLLAEAYGDRLTINITDNSVPERPTITLEQLVSKGIPNHDELRRRANETLGQYGGTLVGDGDPKGADGSGQAERGEGKTGADTAKPEVDAQQSVAVSEPESAAAELPAPEKKSAPAASIDKNDPELVSWLKERELWNSKKNRKEFLKWKAEQQGAEPAASESAPAEPAPDAPQAAKPRNRLKRRDGTDPLVEREAAKEPQSAAPEPPAESRPDAAAKAGGEPAPPSATESAPADSAPPLAAAKPAPAEPPKKPLSRTIVSNRARQLGRLLDGARREDGAFDPDRLRNWHDNKGLKLQELKTVRDNPEIIDALKLPEADAKSLREAVSEAYARQWASSSNKNGKANESGQDTYAVSASKALDRLARDPDSLKYLAIAQQQVASAYEAARRQGDEKMSAYWKRNLVDLEGKIGGLHDDERAKYASELAKLQNKLSPMERKNRKSRVDKEGNDIDVAIDSDMEKMIDQMDASQRSHSGSRRNADNQFASDVLFSADRNKAVGEEADGKSAASDLLTLMHFAEAKTGSLKVLGVENGNITFEWKRKGKETLRQTISVDQIASNLKAQLRKSGRLTDAGRKDLQKALDLVEELKGGSVRDVRSQRGAAEPPEHWDAAERETAGKAAKAVAGWLPGVKIRFADPSEQPSSGDADVSGSRVLHDDAGTAVGTYNRATNEVTLYRGATTETVFHEIGGHATMKFAEDESAAGRPELLNKLNAAIDAAPKRVKDAIDRAYADKDGNIRRDEVLADLFGKKGDKAFRDSLKTLEGRTWYNRVWKAVKEAWRGIMRKMGFDVDSVSMRKLDRLRPEEIVDWLVKQMIEGKRLKSSGDDLKPPESSNVSRNSRGQNFSLDNHGRMKPTMEQRKDANDGLQAQGNRLSEQGNRNGVGGESEAFKRGDSLLAGASAVGRRVEGRVQESTRVRDKEAESQTRLVDYAKENGVWDGNVERTLDERYGTEEGQKNTDGGEAVVWFDRKRGVAVKAIGLDYYGSPMLALERVQLHNKYFPDTKLSLVGFGAIPNTLGKDGEVELYGRTFNLVVEQPLIDTVRELTKSEIRSRLEAQGFKFLKDRGDAGLDMETPDGKAVVSDLHERNVFAGSKGAIKVIDCDIRLKPGEDIVQSAASPDDIRESRRATPEEARKELDETGAETVVDWLDGEDGARRKLRRKYQDKNIGIRDIEEKLGITDKAESAYYAKDRAFGKNEHELNVLREREVKPIVEKIYRSGGSLQQFSEYLYARHADERNAAIYDRTGKMNGSGMSHAEAEEVIKRCRALGLEFAFEDAARDVWAMNRKYLQRRVDSGRMTQDEANHLNWQYKHYVPLRTDMTDGELGSFNRSTGGWKRTELPTAKGRSTRADDPFAFSVVQNEQAIRASNENDVRRTWANVVRKSIEKGTPLGEIVDGRNAGSARWTFDFGDERVEVGGVLAVLRRAFLPGKPPGFSHEIHKINHVFRRKTSPNVNFRILICARYIALCA